MFVYGVCVCVYVVYVHNKYFGKNKDGELCVRVCVGWFFKKSRKRFCKINIRQYPYNKISSVGVNVYMESRGILKLKYLRKETKPHAIISGPLVC